MLVLSRRIGEVVIVEVGEARVAVKVSDVRGERVRIAFDAPRDVRIVREELLERRAS